MSPQKTIPTRRIPIKNEKQTPAEAFVSAAESKPIDKKGKGKDEKDVYNRIAKSLDTEKDIRQKDRKRIIVEFSSCHEKYDLVNDSIKSICAEHQLPPGQVGALMMILGAKVLQQGKLNIDELIVSGSNNLYKHNLDLSNA